MAIYLPGPTPMQTPTPTAIHLPGMLRLAPINPAPSTNPILPSGSTPSSKLCPSWFPLSPVGLSGPQAAAPLQCCPFFLWTPWLSLPSACLPHTWSYGSCILSAGVIFQTRKDGSLPPHLHYKIRQNSSFTEKTNEIRRAYWRPGPNTGGRFYFLYGFVWIQGEGPGPGQG